MKNLYLYTLMCWQHRLEYPGLHRTILTGGTRRCGIELCKLIWSTLNYLADIWDFNPVERILTLTTWLPFNTGLFEMIVGGFNNLPPHSPDATPRDFFLWGYVKDRVCVPPLQRKYPGTEGMNQNCHWNHHRWHATNSLEWTRMNSIIVVMFVESQRVHI